MAQLQFKGKQFVQNHHLTVKFHELVPKKDKSLAKKAGLNDNLIIHGDNLKALKALLPTYGGKVKCVYIDPPYNTGNEKWKYNDNVNSPMMQEWLGKVVDREDLTRHDKWLCMMTPRLKLLRELLRDDGVIFISIDNNEQHHLRMLMDEIFGEENFVADLIWQKGAGTQNDNKYIANSHEYIICYAKQIENCSLSILQEVGFTGDGKKVVEQLFPGSKEIFNYPKPISLIQRCIRIATKNNDIILDSFAGSGTTGHAVLDLNKEDGGNRKFILVEMEDYADKITAERVRRVIKRMENPPQPSFAKGGSKKVLPFEKGTNKLPPLEKGARGIFSPTFSYFELGKPIEMESILSGKNLPTYKELARYVFYTATGEEFDEKAIDEPNNFIGESKEYKVYLFYKPDIEYLKNTALTLDRAQKLGKHKNKKRLVFAPTKYLDQDHLDQLRIDFAQLPFEIYKLTE